MGGAALGWSQRCGILKTWPNKATSECQQCCSKQQDGPEASKRWTLCPCLISCPSLADCAIICSTELRCSSAQSSCGQADLAKTRSHFCAMTFWAEGSTYRHRQLKCSNHFQPAGSVLIKLCRNTFLPRSADVDTAGWAVDEPS